MEQFDIIGALRTYCETNEIKFIWQYDQFYANIEASQAYIPEELIMVVDLKPSPIFSGNKIAQINYSGLFMLGRKFDENGIGTNLDEKAIEKYDNRLKELSQLLISHLATFKCSNELDVVVGQMEYIINLFDSNIDFVAAQNIQIIQ